MLELLQFKYPLYVGFYVILSSYFSILEEGRLVCVEPAATAPVELLSGQQDRLWMYWGCLHLGMCETVCDFRAFLLCLLIKTSLNETLIYTQSYIHIIKCQSKQ